MTDRDRHEGAGPGNPGAAPLSFEGGELQQEATCPCGRWTWYDVHASLGLSAVERYCQRCKARRLVVMRYGEVVGVVSLDSRTVREFRRGLEELLGPGEETEMLVTCAVRATARKAG